jgi:hypothetical protein
VRIIINGKVQNPDIIILNGFENLVCLVWFGLVWFGLVWFGLVWFGLVWFGLVNFDFILHNKED